MNKAKSVTKGFIFDLDGTILDTTGDIRSAINKTLGTSFDDEQTKMFVGNGLKNAIKNALETLQKPVENLDALFNELLVHYRQQPVKYTFSYPGVDDFLKELNKRNIAVGVFSNKEQDLAETVLKLSFPDVRFAFIVGRNGKFPAKPDPAAITAFASLIGASIDEIFYIGDSEVDYRCAELAGVRRAILTWGTRTPKYLQEKGVDKKVLVSSMKEAADLAGLVL